MTVLCCLVLICFQRWHNLAQIQILGVLRELINRVTELSHAISPPNTSTEINNIFNRRQGPQLEQQSVASQSQVAETQATSSRQDSLPIRRNASSTPTTAFSTALFSGC